MQQIKDILGKKLKVGDLVIARLVAGKEHSFFGIIQEFDTLNEEEGIYAYYYKSKQIVVIKPLCTLNGDEISDNHKLDKKGNVRMPVGSRIILSTESELEQYKNRAIKRAERFKEIETKYSTELLN